MDTLVRRDTAGGAPAGASRAGPGPATADLPPAPELGRYLRAVVDARYRVLACTAGAALAAAVLALALPREWTARVVLLPTDDRQGALPAQLTGLATSFGLPVPFGAGSQSDLYPTILQSDRLLGDLLDRPFRAEDGAPEQPLLAILRPGDEDTHRTRMKAIRRLRKKVVHASKDAETGIVALEVSTRDPGLSADVANALTGLLESWLIEVRQQDGRKNRAFIDERLAAASAELGAAESRLTRFREANRRITGSPELQLEEARLRRDVSIQEQVFVELRRQKEIAQIEEVKNTPVLKVLDEAARPIRPSRPLRTLMVAAGLLLGAFLSVSWVLLRTSLRTAPDLADALAPLAGDARRVARAWPRRRHTHAA